MNWIPGSPYRRAGGLELHTEELDARKFLQITWWPGSSYGRTGGLRVLIDELDVREFLFKDWIPCSAWRLTLCHIWHIFWRHGSQRVLIDRLDFRESLQTTWKAIESLQINQGVLTDELFSRESLYVDQLVAREFLWKDRGLEFPYRRAEGKEVLLPRGLTLCHGVYLDDLEARESLQTGWISESPGSP